MKKILINSYNNKFMFKANPKNYRLLHLIFFIVFFIPSCTFTDTKEKDNKVLDSMSHNKAKDSLQTLKSNKKYFSKEDSLLWLKASSDTEKFAEAERLFQENKIADAIKVYKSLIQKKVLSIKSLIHIADLFLEKENAFCLAVCDEIIRLDKEKKSPIPYYFKALYYTKKNPSDTTRIIQNLNLSIIQDWSFVDAYIEKGLVYFKNQDYEKAHKIFAMAQVVNSRFADAYYWMARCEEKMGLEEQAIPNYQRAILFDKNFIQAKEKLHILIEKRKKKK